MKIYSKRHPNSGVKITRVIPQTVKASTVPVLPKSLWDMKPIDMSFFADVYPIEEPDVEMRQAVDMLQRGIISTKQYFDRYNETMIANPLTWAGTDEPVEPTVKFQTRYE